MHAMPRSWSPRPTPSSMPPSAAAAMRSPAAKRSGHVSLPHQRVCLLRRHDVGPSMSHGIGCPVASTDPKVAMLVVLTALIVGVATGFLAGGRLRNLESLALARPWLVLAALGLQLVAFSPVGAALPHPTAVILHFASY